MKNAVLNIDLMHLVSKHCDINTFSSLRCCCSQLNKRFEKDYEKIRHKMLLLVWGDEQYLHEYKEFFETNFIGGVFTSFEKFTNVYSERLYDQFRLAR